MPRRTDSLEDRIAELVIERIEQRVSATAPLIPATATPKWTDRLAATLRDIRLRRLASGDGADVVGDQPER